MTKEGRFWCVRKFHYFSKNRGLGNSKIVSTKPYQVVPRVQGIDKRTSIAQFRDVLLNPTQDGSQLKLTIRPTLIGCHFGYGWRTQFYIAPLFLFSQAV